MIKPRRLPAVWSSSVRTLALAAVSLGACVASPATAQTAPTGFDFTAGPLYVFGDSLSDTGNTGPAYLNGQYSNGPVWWTYVTPNKPLALDPFLTGIVGPTTNGVNFAHGGAQTGDITVPVAPGITATDPGSLSQAAAYAGLVANGTLPKPAANATFSVWIGGNNFLGALETGSTPDIAGGVTQVGQTLGLLARAGAHQFILFGLPPIGTATTMVPAPYQAGVNALVTQWNAGVRQVDATITQQFGAKVMFVDVQGVINDIFTSPSTYGYSVLHTSCLSAGLVLSQCPNSYFSYDGIHPTGIGHQILGQYVLANAANLNVGGADYAQLLSAGYELNHDVTDALADNARWAADARLPVYLFARTVDGHVAADGLNPRISYAGHIFGGGIELALGDHVHAGLSLASLGGTANAGGALPVRAPFDETALAANLLYRAGGFSFALDGGTGTLHFDTTRATGFAYRPSVTAHWPVNTYFVSAEAGERFALGKAAAVTPYVRAAHSQLIAQGVSEHGPLLNATLSTSRLNSWVIAGGAKLDVPLGGGFSFAAKAEVSGETAGKGEVDALYSGVDTSVGLVEAGRGTTARGSVGINAALGQRALVKLEAGGHTSKSVTDGYAALTARFSL